jgi:hypothetical protein
MTIKFVPYSECSRVSFDREDDMKKQVSLLVIAVLTLFLRSSAYGLDYMGPPVAGLKKGRFKAGVDLAAGVMDLEIRTFGIIHTLRDVRSRRYLGSLSYGLADEWEAFVRLGGDDTKAPGGFKGDQEFAYGFGTKITLAGEDTPSWGALLQLGRGKSKSYYSESIPGFFFPVSGDAEMDWYEVQAALGGNYDMDDYRLYSGVFLHYLRGDFDVASDTFPVTWEFDLREKSVLGAYVGARFYLWKKANIDTEFQFTADAWAFGVGLGHKF